MPNAAALPLSDYFRVVVDDTYSRSTILRFSTRPFQVRVPVSPAARHQRHHGSLSLDIMLLRITIACHGLLFMTSRRKFTSTQTLS